MRIRDRRCWFGERSAPVSPDELLRARVWRTYMTKSAEDGHASRDEVARELDEEVPAGLGFRRARPPTPPSDSGFSVSEQASGVRRRAIGGA